MILGIETSCDETAAGIVDLDGRLLANVVASQADIHARYGGIVPEVASRQHIRDIANVVRAALDDASITWEDLDAIAVTNGPGLAGSLMVGVNFAKGASATTGKPLIGVNHLVGHVMAAFIRLPTCPDGDDQPNEKAPADSHQPLAEALAELDEDRAMCLIVSGGHTELVLARQSDDALEFLLVGETRDDAAGEAFDKAARAIGLPYPGGPAIQTPPNPPMIKSSRCPERGFAGPTSSPSAASRPRFSPAPVRRASIHGAIPILNRTVRRRQTSPRRSKTPSSTSS